MPSLALSLLNALKPKPYTAQAEFIQGRCAKIDILTHLVILTNIRSHSVDWECHLCVDWECHLRVAMYVCLVLECLAPLGTLCSMHVPWLEHVPTGMSVCTLPVGVHS